MRRAIGNAAASWSFRWAAMAALCAVAIVLVGHGVARAAEVLTTFVEDFEDGRNEGAWTFGTGNEYLNYPGGNPSVYLRDDSLVSFHPKASTSFGQRSEFTGNYFAQNVASVGIDLATIDASLSISSRTISLILLNDNGSPQNLDDDWGAIFVSDKPVPPSGVIGDSDILNWVSYDFAVPSDSAELPEGWELLTNPDANGPQSWSRLMKGVDHVGFSYGDPRILALIGSYSVALDNPRITTRSRR